MFLKAEKAKSTPISGRSIPSLVSSELEIEGNLTTPGELQLDGTIEGDVTCEKLMVGERASVTGRVQANEVVIRGKIIGNVKANNVEMAKTAHVIGDIWHDTLAIDAGAFLEGHCRHNDGKPVTNAIGSLPANVIPVGEVPSKDKAGA